MSTNLIKHPNYLTRLVYYIKSFICLFLNIEGFIFILPKLISKIETHIKTKEGHEFFCRDLMELWTIKETIFEDVYRIKRFQSKYKIETVIDIGGAFGDFDIFIQILAPYSTCYVFEPQQLSCDQLKKNIALNKLNEEQIIVSNTAVSNTDDKAFFTKNVSTNGLANGEMVFFESTEGSIEINFSNFNHFLKEIDKEIDILKVDCEGGEYNIIPSIDLKYLKKIKFITMEWHEFSKDHDHRVIHKHLEQNNFDVISLKSPVHNEIGYLFAKNKLFNW